ncbi:MAG: Nif3-like dinuclear metal center hexameric protein [SAR86 cluster bacterium]|uniref:GTP cyclohydrolase 1 type 2 homolog n=1 Tax=SAR86 cluster bacterium TaxID=2030880 RepID=A0A2A4XH91_9GAMM|nr:MAG: Nif3-like dinuclear metal center hexameric protein [SAR86 cluster bacterium]
MPVSLKELELELKQVLRPEQFKDYCPNGLQVEGRKEISKLVTGVTACQELIDAAVEAGADALLVHHGYFWRGEDQSISGIKKSRIETLLKHDLSLLAYHLPLDVHREFGNNVQLAKVLGIEIDGELGKQNNHPIGLTGTIDQGTDFESLKALLADKLGRQPLAIEGNSKPIRSIAWCTGAAQNYIELAVAAGVDAYITGEVSEPTVHIARESGIHFFSAGHHATERYGVQAIGRHLASKFGLDHQFIDIDNPV